MLAGHLIAVACLLATLPMLFLWLRHEGLAWDIGLWLTGMFALMPGTYLLALNIWTENLYLCLGMAALLLQRRVESIPGGHSRLPWLAAIAVALATLTRAAALPLLAAFAIHLLILRPRHWPWLGMVAALPFGLWAAAGHSQSGFSSYLAQFSDRYAQHSFGALYQQFAAESQRLVEAWVRGWTGAANLSSLLSPVALLIGVICLAGWLGRLLQRRFDALYVALYLPLLLIWPFPAEAGRLEYVLVPVLLAQGGLLLQALVGALGGAARRLQPVAFIAILGVTIAPSLALTVQRYFVPAPDGYELVKHTPEWYGDGPLRSRAALLVAVNLSALHEVADLVPPGACLFSIKPAVVTLYTGRASYMAPPVNVDDGAFDHAVGCRYIYAMALVSPSFPEPFYPLKQLNGRGKSLLRAAAGDETRQDTYGLLIDLGIDRSPPG